MNAVGADGLLSPGLLPVGRLFREGWPAELEPRLRSGSGIASEPAGPPGGGIPGLIAASRAQEGVHRD